MTNLVTSVIDFFYPPFRRLMPLQTFRYAACGGINIAIVFLLFTGIYNYLSGHMVVYVGPYPFEPYSIALFLAGASSFIVGFLLNKYVVFTTSNLRGRIQFFRYFLSFASNLAINYFLLKLFVRYLYIHPVVAQVIATATVVTIGYFTQQYFTFRVQKNQPD